MGVVGGTNGQNRPNTSQRGDSFASFEMLTYVVFLSFVRFVQCGVFTVRQVHGPYLDTAGGLLLSWPSSHMLLASDVVLASTWYI